MDTPDNGSPIFVRGFSRSGGTLVVTLLDAHPDIAMSYELYPNLLAADDGPIDWLEVGRHIREAKSLNHAAKRMPTRGLRTFVSRSARGGLEAETLSDLFDVHMGAGQGFESVADRLRFIERCCLQKMERDGKRRWGLKCSNQYDHYHRLWPDACFINVVRDGRDVLSSQLRTGSFENPPEAVGRGWANTHDRFRKLAQKDGVRAREVFYERLAENPEQETRELCAFLGVPYDEEMLRFHDRDLSIYRSHHLSMDRISVPIDSSKIGRWRNELTPEQLSEFLSTAGDEMRRLGYVEASGC